MKEKNIVITGAGSDLGVEIVKQNPTYKFFQFDIADNEDSVIPMDVTQYEKVVSAISESVGNTKVDGIVNLPSINLLKSFKEYTIEEINQVIAVKLNGYINVVKALQNNLAQGASIINISSVHAFRTYEGFVPYAVANAGVNSFSKSLAIDLRNDNIRVNAVAPGGFLTSGYKRDNNDWEEKYKNGQLLSVEQVANVVTFLLDDKSSGINGAEIIVDGGVSTLKVSSSQW